MSEGVGGIKQNEEHRWFWGSFLHAGLTELNTLVQPTITYLKSVWNVGIHLRA